jgi:hypothetical protein
MGHDPSFGDVGSMSGLPESGHGWRVGENVAMIHRALRRIN